MTGDAEFVNLLTKAQFELRLHIVSFVGNVPEVDDILQEANMYIWRKADTYDPSRPFLPWARTMAKFQVMCWRKKCERDRLVLDESAFASIPADALADISHDVQLEALRHSLKSLDRSERMLLRAKYVNRKNVGELSSLFSQSESAVVSRLYRIRKSLRVEASCMAMGQVAGEVAALAALSRRTPLDVPLGEARKGLAASGAIVPDVPEGEPLPRRSRP